MNDIKAAYKRKAKIYHPDRMGGNQQQFQLLTMAYMALIEKYKRMQQDKQFMTLKEESQLQLRQQNKTVVRRAARLTALAFIFTDNPDLNVIHIDKIKLNDVSTNLKWE